MSAHTRALAAITAVCTLLPLACGDSTGPDALMPASIELYAGDEQGGAINARLDSAVAVQVRDVDGIPIPDLAVTFIASDGGSADPVEAMTDDKGVAATQWTLGAEEGVQTLQAVPARGNAGLSVSMTAYAHAGVADTVLLSSGDAQSELAGRALPAPVRVQVFDEAGHPVPDVSVFFTTVSGSVEPAEAFTDLDGIAEAVWTLADTEGDHSLSARVFRMDPANSDSVEVAGSPVAFTSSTVRFEVVDASEAVAGEVVTISGTGFDPVPARNAVAIDEVSATVLDGTQTTLTVRVPSFGCQPAAQRDIVVRRGDLNSSVSVDIHGEHTLDLEVGEYVIVSDPALYCLQMAASNEGSDLHLVGLTGTQPLNGIASFVLSTSDGTIAAPAAETSLISRMSSTVAVTTAGTLAATDPETQLRAWEQAFLATRPKPVTGINAPSSLRWPDATANVVGATLDLRVPTITTDPCNQYTTIDATVVAVGPRIVVAADPDLPPSVLAELESDLAQLIDLFAIIHERATTYLGEPAWISADERITIVLTPVAGDLGVAAFSTAVDLVDRATCPSSDAREIVYVNVPESPTGEQLRTLLSTAGPNLTHELAHSLLSSRRLQEGLAALPGWLAEGVAELAIEVVGHLLRGDDVGMDLGAGALAADALAPLWYQPRFDRLALFYGWDGASGRTERAPAQCSLFGFGGPSLPCSPGFAQGAAWSFIRYLSDRLGAGYPGGEAALHRMLAGMSAQDLLLLIQSRAGDDLSELIVHWAMTLYTDNRIAGETARQFQMSSWDLESIALASAPQQRLSPVELGFTASRREGAIVGGGTAYFTIEATGAHGPLAVEVHDPAGNPLGTELQPRLWVVRIR